MSDIIFRDCVKGNGVVRIFRNEDGKYSAYWDQGLDGFCNRSRNYTKRADAKKWLVNQMKKYNIQLRHHNHNLRAK